MSFQKQVYTEQALGREGFISRENPIVNEPMMAEGSDVKAGKFGFTGTEAGVQVLGVKAGATSVEGVIVYSGLQVATSLTNSLDVLDGQEANVIKFGYVFVRPTTVSTRGQGVYVNPTTGEIQTASSAPANFIDTGFKVSTGALANEVAEISKI